jgi:hypothetical protein
VYMVAYALITSTTSLYMYIHLARRLA